jgi:hypothetical protein
MYRFPRVVAVMAPHLLVVGQEMRDGTYVEPTTYWVDDDRPDFPEYQDSAVDFGGGD